VSRSLSFYGRTRQRRAMPPEASLQVAVVEALRLLGVPGLVYFRVPNDAKRSPQAGLWEQRMGLLKGVADLCVLVPDKPALFLELKAAGKKAAPEQMAFADAVNRAGHRWSCVDNIDIALDLLTHHGAIRQRRKAAA
jgi:hypothetical protein